MTEIILASSSPRRSMLLRQAGIPFHVYTPQVAENEAAAVHPADLVKSLGIRKAEKTLDDLSASMFGKEIIIISADTIVSIEGRVMGKPCDQTEAFHMLQALQGRCHQVYTGMTVVHKKDNDVRFLNYTDNTLVYMKPLNESEIWDYINTGEPMDKAGAYGIQERGAFLIEKIEGDYFTVVGLPLTKLYAALKECGINPLTFPSHSPEAH